MHTPRYGTGCRRRDIFDRFTVDEMVSIVVAAQPGTAVYHAISGGWTISDHLIATLYEHQAGLASLPNRIPRPGVTDLRPGRLPDLRDPKTKKLLFDSMTIDEFEARRAARVKGG